MGIQMTARYQKQTLPTVNSLHNSLLLNVQVQPTTTRYVIPSMTLLQWHGVRQRRNRSLELRGIWHTQAMVLIDVCEIDTNAKSYVGCTPQSVLKKAEKDCLIGNEAKTFFKGWLSVYQTNGIITI